MVVIATPIIIRPVVEIFCAFLPIQVSINVMVVVNFLSGPLLMLNLHI